MDCLMILEATYDFAVITFILHIRKLNFTDFEKLATDHSFFFFLMAEELESPVCSNLALHLGKSGKYPIIM